MNRRRKKRFAPPMKRQRTDHEPRSEKTQEIVKDSADKKSSKQTQALANQPHIQQEDNQSKQANGVVGELEQSPL